MWSTGARSYQAVFSPDGRQLAAADLIARCVKIFASETGALLRTLSGHSDVVAGVAWSSTGIVASASEDHTVRLWNPGNGICFQTLACPAPTSSVAFSPDAKWLASGHDNKAICVWDVASGTCFHTLSGHPSFVLRVAFSPDGSKLASSSYDGTVYVWDASIHFNCIWSHPANGNGIRPNIAWSPDSRSVAKADGITLKLWDESGMCLLQSTNQASAVAFSRFSLDIITGGKDNKVSRWESPITWPLDWKRGIPFGKIHPPSKYPHDISGTLDRISTIIARMDPPIAFRDLINILHELNHPFIANTKRKEYLASNLQQALGELASQQQNFLKARSSLQLKASQRRRLAEAKENLGVLESSVQLISLVKDNLAEYFQLTDDPSPQAASSKEYDHSSPRDISPSQLFDILSFAQMSNAKLKGLEKAVIESASIFEKALLAYDLHSAEIREESERNIDKIAAFLAHRPSTSVSSDLIGEIERTLVELQVVLDKDRDIMSRLDQSLSEYSSAKNELNKILEKKRLDDQSSKASTSKAESVAQDSSSAAMLESDAHDSATSEPKGSGWMQRLKGGLRKQPKETKKSSDDLHQPQASLPPKSPPPPPSSSALEIDSAESLERQQIEKAKSHLRSTSEIVNNPHLIYKWLMEHPDTKVEEGELFEIIGVC